MLAAILARVTGWKGGIYDHAKLDVPHLLRAAAPRRVPYPRTRRDGAPELPGISSLHQSVA
jgi:hypothetical protein